MILTLVAYMNRRVANIHPTSIPKQAQERAIKRAAKTERWQPPRHTFCIETLIF